MYERGVYNVLSRVHNRIGVNRMSITSAPMKSKEKIRLMSKKALEEFLKKGGKITIEEEGKTTSAATMKYKYRNARKKKVPEE